MTLAHADHAGVPTLHRAGTRALAREAVVFRNHVALTADRAWLACKHVPSIKAFVGIVLRA